MIMESVGLLKPYFWPLFYITCLIIIHPVRSYYCDHDLCSSNEYCCGDDLCCIYTNWTYYLWLLLVIVILVISLCWASFNLYYGDLRPTDGRPFLVKLIDKIVQIFPSKYKSATLHSVPSSPKESTRLDFTDDSENGNNDSMV